MSCACPSTDAHACIAIRYPARPNAHPDGEEREVDPCDCSCHEDDDCDDVFWNETPAESETP